MSINLQAVIGLDSKGFVSSVKSAQSSISSFKNDLISVAEFAGISFASFKGAQAIGDGFKSIFGDGKALRAEARATGESITDLITLRKAYKEVGMDEGSLQNNLTMLRSALGGVNAEGEPTKAIFDQLGISVEKMKGMTAVQQLKAIGEAISHLATQEDKVAAVRAIFGRQGAEMLNILGDPKAIEDAAASTAEKAAVYEKNAALFASVTNRFENIGMKVQGFFLGAGEGAAQALDPLLSQIEKLDSIKIGEKLGIEIKAGLGALQSGRIDELLNPQIDLIGMRLNNVFAGAVAAFGDSFVALGDKLTATLLRAFKGPLASLQAGIDYSTSQLIAQKGDQSFWGTAMNYAGAYATGGIPGVMEQMTTGKSSGRELIKDKLGLGDANQSWADINKEHHGSDIPVMTPEGIKTAKDFDQDAKDRGEKAKGRFQKVASGQDADSAYSSKQVADKLREASDVVKNFASRIKSSVVETGSTGGKKFSLAGDNVKGAGDPQVRSMRENDSDRLAKIGGFIGGGGPDNDHARRAADATTTIVSLLKSVISTGFKIVAPDRQGGGDAYA